MSDIALVVGRSIDFGVNLPRGFILVLDPKDFTISLYVLFFLGPPRAHQIAARVSLGVLLLHVVVPVVGQLG